MVYDTVLGFQKRIVIFSENLSIVMKRDISDECYWVLFVLLPADEVQKVSSTEY